jgi:hypothetical protein
MKGIIPMVGATAIACRARRASEDHANAVLERFMVCGLAREPPAACFFLSS